MWAPPALASPGALRTTDLLGAENAGIARMVSNTIRNKSRAIFISLSFSG